MKAFTWLGILIGAGIGLLLPSTAPADEVRPGVLRTPDDRFQGLAGYPFAPNYMDIGGYRIHYLDEGPADGQPILLIHGEPTWSYLFRTMIPVLTAAGHRVITPDLVGFGRSDKPIDKGDYSYQMQVDIMLELVTRLNLENVTFFGQDWGGLIGLRVVAAAYEAPFPDARYKAGAQIMPYLVPSQLRENEEAWQVFEAWNKPFLVAFTDSDPITRGGEQVFINRVPSAVQVTIAGAGHFVQEDAGPELAALINTFIRGEPVSSFSVAAPTGRN